MLAIAFIPSLVFLLTGVAMAGYLIYDAIQVRSFTTKVHNAAEPAGVLFASLREERRLTLQELATTRSLRAELDQQRRQTDEAARRMAADLESIAEDAPANVRESTRDAQRRLQQLAELRQRVDNGDTSLQEAYDFYNGIIDTYTVGLNGVAQETPNAETAYKRMVAMPLFVSADSMSRGYALAAAGIESGGLTEQEFRTYIGQIGTYHSTLEQAVPDMVPSVREKYEQLVASDAWETLTRVENAFLRGNTTELPVPEPAWHAAAAEVSGALWNLYVEQSTVATELALDEAEATLTTSIVAGTGVIAVALAVSLLAWRMSDRLAKRLVSLREATLEVADERMPRIIERLRDGEQVDLESEVSYLDHGDDEIGEVAEAFNKAQRTAIAAAVDEAKTREGTRKVFLNIAHRSQVIVHRQLAVLDAAERKQEDPDQLDLLFRLDHLSTRARRNAENLIILGGEQPGRQFRKPVPLIDIVRGAIAETEDYKRVSTNRLPDIAVVGPVVSDLVHLLAELLDNATSFSPPQSRVEVRGELVGRGVVIEIEDQGIGMEADELDRFNRMLRNPPDFGFMALTEESRLGLFVVARLAAKHHLTVTLRESAYGGTRAIVLVRTELLSEIPTEIEGESVSGVEGTATLTTSLPASGGVRPVPRRQPKALPSRAGDSAGDSAGDNDGQPTDTSTATGISSGALSPGEGVDTPTTQYTPRSSSEPAEERRGLPPGGGKGRADSSNSVRPELPRRERRRKHEESSQYDGGYDPGVAAVRGRLLGNTADTADAADAVDAAEVTKITGSVNTADLDVLGDTGNAASTADGTDVARGQRQAEPSSDRPGKHADDGDRPTVGELFETMSEAELSGESWSVPTQHVPRLPRELPRAPRPNFGSRPRHEARPAQEQPLQRSWPDNGPSTPAPSSGTNALNGERPPLPRRRRQQNLAPQLREETTSTDLTGGDDEYTTTPEQARSRLSAFQQGTRRARQHHIGSDDSGD